MSYTILSFCGGGNRGLISATLLNRLWPDGLVSADLLAGISTGSTIVSQIVAGKSTDKIVDEYLGPTVKFMSNPGTDPAKPAYSVDEVLASQIVLHKGNPSLSSITQSVLLPAFNVGGFDVPWRAEFFSNMAGGNADATLPEAVVGSSAMPGQFGSMKGLVDGGFVMHDPTLAAVAFAVNAGHGLEDLRVIGFGTGLMADWVASDSHRWGAQQWMQGDDNGDNNTPIPLVNGTVCPVLSMSLNGPTTSITPTLCQLLLGSNYVYLNCTLDRYIPENEVNKVDLDYMIAQADAVDITAAQDMVERYWRKTEG